MPEELIPTKALKDSLIEGCLWRMAWEPAWAEVRVGWQELERMARAWLRALRGERLVFVRIHSSRQLLVD